MREYDIFFLGDEDSGKSSVFNYYSNDKNDDNLIGIRKTSKKKKIGKHSETQFNFYDISPQECNKKIVKDLYQDVDLSYFLIQKKLLNQLIIILILFQNIKKE